MESAKALSSNTNLALLINNIKTLQSFLIDWKQENLNFVPLRGGWFANSEEDFDLEEEINKFLLPKNNKKAMLLMGDSGAGKSLYTQGLVNKLWQNFSAQSPIPIWITLPSLKDPVNKVIEETFDKYGVSKDQIEELRKTRSFIFILDAYDEIRCEKNLYQTNNLDKWNAKIIITCRREYLYHKDNYKLFFAPFVGDKIQYMQYEEIYIKPFNANQILTYVQQYIKTHIPNWANPERYIKAIEEITGLKELIKTPFMLKLAIEVLPQIIEKYATVKLMERKKVTQAALYDVFIEQWFIRQEKKLKEAKLIKEGEDIKPEFWNYAKELATEMHKANITHAVYDPNKESDLFVEVAKVDPWKKYFNNQNPKIELLKTACLIRETSLHHYAFIHSSLMEYFLTRQLYENLSKMKSANEIKKDNYELERPTQIALEDRKQKSSKLLSTSKPAQQPDILTKQSSKQEYFNQRLITQEANILQFLADRIEDQDEFKKILFERVYSSRNNPINQIAAANAVTILNRARTPFSGMDLSGIQIPNADLSYSYLQNVNLEGADLQNVSLKQSYLCDADMSNCYLENINLGQLPHFVSELGPITAICYTNDGHFIGIASQYEIKLWDQVSGRHIIFCHHSDLITSIAFSPDGKLLASGGENCKLNLWTVDINREFSKPLIIHESFAACVAFSPDRNLLASGDRKIIRLWDLVRNLPAGEISNGGGDVTSIIFSPNGKLLASGSSDHLVRLWSLDTRNLIGKPLEGHTGEINSLAFSPDGKILASCCYTLFGIESPIRLWDVENVISLEPPLIWHMSEVKSIAISPDGKMLASGGRDKKVRLWSLENRKPICQPLTGHTDPIVNVSFSPDGRFLASASIDRTVRLWDVAAQLSSDFHNNLNDKLICQSSVTICPDSKLVACGSYEGTVCFYSIEKQRLVGKPLMGHTGTIYCVVFSHDGKLLASGGDDKTIRLWDVQTQMQRGTNLNGHTQSITSIVFSSDDKILVSGSFDKTICIWDLERHAQLGNPLTGHTDQINKIALSPNSKILASCSGSESGNENAIRLWDMITKTPLGQPLTGHHFEVKAIDFSHDGKILASGSCDKTVCLWDVERQILLDKTSIETLMIDIPPIKMDEVYSVAYIADGGLAVGGIDKKLRLFSVVNSKLNHGKTIFHGSYTVHNITFCKNKRYIVFLCGYEFALMERKQDDCYYLKWNFGSSSLFANNLNIIKTKNLSNINNKLLIQLGAIGIDLNEDYLEKTDDKPRTYYSTVSPNSPVLFKPTSNANTKEDNTGKKIEDKKALQEKEKCKLM